MSIIDRHKKPGGFRKLVLSLEVTAPEKRGSIIDSFREEDPIFAEDVSKCIFNFEEFADLSDTVICEILHFANMKSLAYSLYKSAPQIIERFKKNIPPKMAILFRDEMQAIGDIRIADQMAARFRIIEAARDCEDKGYITLRKMNPNYL